MSMPASAGSGPTDMGRQLFRAALEYAERRGYVIGDGATGDIENFAIKAALDIEQRKLGENGMSEAERAFEKLIDNMIEEARQIPGYAIQRPNIIGEQTLARALNRLCPLWPFC
jgi:hypothetical protein